MINRNDRARTAFTCMDDIFGKRKAGSNAAKSLAV